MKTRLQVRKLRLRELSDLPKVTQQRGGRFKPTPVLLDSACSTMQSCRLLQYPWDGTLQPLPGPVWSLGHLSESLSPSQLGGSLDITQAYLI